MCPDGTQLSFLRLLPGPPSCLGQQAHCAQTQSSGQVVATMAIALRGPQSRIQLAVPGPATPSRSPYPASTAPVCLAGPS